MTIKIAGLSDCDKCKTLRKKLKESGLNHSFSDCDKDPGNCDNLEALTGTSSYPIMLVQDSDDKVLEVYFLTDRYETLIRGSYSQNGIRLIPAHSTDSLLRYAENRLNLKL